MFYGAYGPCFARRTPTSQACAPSRNLMPLSPLSPTLLSVSDRKRWRRTCALLVVPGAAVLHHALFFPRTCMWVPFEGGDDRAADVRRLLREDGSLPWAVALAAATYRLGKRQPGVRRLCAPLVPGFFPLAVWLWDLPFSRRALCEYLHDGKLAMGGRGVRTAHVYALSAGLYAALLALGARGPTA